MFKKKIFYFSFLVTLSYCVSLQISFAKNFFETSFDEICSNEKSSKKNNDNLSCSYHCVISKFDDLNLKEHNKFFVINNFATNPTLLKQIYYKFLLLPKNNSPPKLL